jgi:hypothetical protein
MSQKDRTAELRKIRAYVNRAERELNALEILPRAAHKFPFDIVGLATLSKAFAIAEACLKLLASDCPDEAYSLSRSLVECATNLRYLTSDLSELDKRTRDFVKFALADKAFWYHHTLEVAKTPKQKAELRAYAKQMGLVDNPEPARQHWSGQGSGFVWTTTLLAHPLDGPATVDHRKKAHAVDYYQTSGFVHVHCLPLTTTSLKTGCHSTSQLLPVITKRINQRSLFFWFTYITQSLTSFTASTQIDLRVWTLYSRER